MRKCNIVKGKMFLFLVAAILVLCVGFLIVGCGAGPAQKATNYNRGNYAVDFNACTTSLCQLNPAKADFPDIAGDTLTIEAMIKPKAASGTTANGIFGRYDSKGALLFAQDTDGSNLNIPKFTIRVATSPTSTDYTVSSGTPLTNDTWYHVAGVLAPLTSGHVHAVTTSCTAAADTTETHHVDIYIDGVFKDCASTNSNGVTEPAKDLNGTVDTNNAQVGFINTAYTPQVLGNVLASDTQFEGVIDEVRLWTSERTATEIDNCKGVELTTTSSECNIDDPSLIGYWMFNEGEHADVHDMSGNSVTGTLEDANALHWEAGWVTGAF